MRINFKELKQSHPNSEIWIIGGGASMNYVHPSFFDGKIVIGINEAFTKYQHCTYFMRKDGRGWLGRDVIEHIKTVSPASKLIVSDYNGCAKEWGQNIFDTDLDYWYFDHPCGHGEMDESVLPRVISEGIFPNGIGSSGIAIAIAAYLGAKNIILCGNDAVKLDGKGYFKEYDNPTGEYICPMSHEDVLNWQNGQNVIVANFFRKTGINIHGLNAFINLRLEEHTYIR